jgi:hypothetical protein
MLGHNFGFWQGVYWSIGFSISEDHGDLPLSWFILARSFLRDIWFSWVGYRSSQAGDDVEAECGMGAIAFGRTNCLVVGSETVGNAAVII